MELFLSMSATILSIILNISPYKTIKEIEIQGDTQNFAFIPFIAIFMNATLACAYGILIFNTTIIFVNSLGVIFSSYYIWKYIQYTRDSNKIQQIKTILLIVLVFIFAILYHIYFRINENARFQLGLISNFATICMFASPLSSLSTIIRTQNASIIPVWLSIASFMCSLVWLLYGITLKDFFVMIPNMIGLFLSSLQLFLVKLYGQRKTTKMELSDV